MDVLQIFKDAGALLEGHFLLSSGLHSSQYLQCAKVLENPQTAEKLCQALAGNFRKAGITAVIGPAMGGIILAYELARALGARALFAEREQGQMCLRRGFALSSRDKALVCEDVVTTGGSAKEVAALVRASGATLSAVCSLADRSEGRPDFGAPFISLFKAEIVNFAPPDCPLCRQGVKLVKPGSR